MISTKLRNLARALARMGNECEDHTITLREAADKCTSLAINFLSLANQAEAMENSVIWPETLTLIAGGKKYEFIAEPGTVEIPIGAKRHAGIHIEC